jgi:uncharacterized protein YdcH (DUF465 family)
MTDDEPTITAEQFKHLLEDIQEIKHAVVSIDKHFEKLVSKLDTLDSSVNRVDEAITNKVLEELKHIYNGIITLDKNDSD